MRKLLLLTTMGLLLCAASGFVGCSDDDNNISGPTAEDTAKVDMFMSEYSGIDEVNGHVVSMTMHFIDSIMEEASASKVAAVVGIHMTLDWHSASEFWYCTAVDTTEEGEVFSYIDSIQFLHGEESVQWPVDSLVTEVRSFQRLHVTSEMIDTATIWQNLVFTVLEPQDDTLHASGSGGLLAEVHEVNVEGNDSTLCDVSYDMDFTYNHLKFLDTGEGLNLSCPRSGSLAATGTFGMSCTGTNESTLGGTWSVTEEFDDGMINFTIQHGGFTFKGSDSCD